MKIKTEDFRVRDGDDVDLKKWPTIVNPVYKSKAQYKKLLANHVVQLSDQQQLFYASDRHAVLLVFQAMDAAGKDGAIRHVMSGINPQGLPGVQLQTAQRDGAATRLSVAHDTGSAGARAYRNIQPILLRGSPDCSRASRDTAQ